MGIVRNGIDIEGITPENELPAEINGQLIELSETENLTFDNEINISNIQKIIIDTEIKGTKIINAPLSRIFVTDGYKKFNISYYDAENSLKAIELTSPFNIFFDVENSSAEVKEMRLYIADAYFELTGSNILYCYIIYMADIRYLREIKNKQETIIKINKQNDDYSIPKETAVQEMSISKYNKGEPEKKVYGKTDSENSLLDIEAEYL